MSEDLETIRHSTAHVMAAAVLDLFPGTLIGIGPATDEGFYYDFGFQERLLPEHLPKIEARMREILKTGTPFTKEEIPKAEALRCSAVSFLAVALPPLRPNRTAA